MKSRRNLVAFVICLTISIVTCRANSIYVSSSVGNDSYDGQSEARPVKTIVTALAKADTVLLKGGDVFYVGSLTISKKFLSRYGKGNNPTICGYKRVKVPRWKKVEQNVWCINLLEDNFTGIVIQGSSISNNICAFHDYEKDLIHGRKVWHKEELMEDWDFWQTETLSKAKPEEYDNLYLYLEGNPNAMNLEMSIWDFALRADNAVIDGVNFIGFGTGILAGTKTIIRNCRVDAIGGRIIPESDTYVCYGNGIEFWVSGELDTRDCIVENCYVTRCYDCGITIQGSRGSTATPTPRNIHVINNLIEDCCQGWEDFLTNEDTNLKFIDCVFEDNIVLNSGNTTGFGYTKGRSKYCHVLGNNYLGNRGMIFRKNTFVGGNYLCAAKYDGAFKSNIWEGNICYIKRGEWLLRCINKGDEIIRIPVDEGEYRTLKAATDDAIRRYRELTGDNTTNFVIMKEKKIDRIINKLKRKYLNMK